jgi:hypothetical protein
VNAQIDPSPAEAWLRDHADRLAEIAQERGLALRAVQLVAVLVLAGFSDPEIFNELGSARVSLDGPRDPLAGAPAVLDELRRLVASERGE